MTKPEFISSVCTNPVNRIILERLPGLNLPDCWLVSGALFQTIWNIQTRRPPRYAIKDYDVFYFDPDLSYAAEDAVIHAAKRVFADVDAEVEVRNQARVHLWYEQKFGMAYPALARATAGIDRFLMPCAQVGIRSDLVVYAPKGFEDIERMTVRPNDCPNFHAERYKEKALRWKERWPELTILPP